MGQLVEAYLMPMGWTPPHLNRHLGAKLELLSTSEKEEGDRNEDYPSWRRFG